MKEMKMLLNNNEIIYIVLHRILEVKWCENCNDDIESGAADDLPLVVWSPRLSSRVRGTRSVQLQQSAKMLFKTIFLPVSEMFDA